jgi:hypothetical protein
MRTKQTLHLLVFIFVLCLGPSSLRAQTSAEPDAPLLRNGDVLLMVSDGMRSGDIINKILTSRCNFDIFPPVLRDLRRRGVPDTVLLAMKMAPSGPARFQPQQVEANKISLTAPARITSGTAIEIESARAVSSGNVSVGTPISFVVTKRIFANNVLIVERGALAQGRVTDVKKAAMLGRPGMLAWSMDYVVAVDGTHIPARVAGKQTGANRAAALAGGAAATAALVFPYSSPVALIWGLKKGEEAVLRGSKIYSAVVATETEVAGIQPRPGGAIYHDQETVKASAAPPTNTNFEQGFKAKGGYKPGPNR